MTKGKMATQQEQIDELHDLIDEILAINHKMIQALKAHQDILEDMSFMVLQTDTEG